MPRLELILLHLASGDGYNALRRRYCFGASERYAREIVDQYFAAAGSIRPQLTFDTKFRERRDGVE